MEVGGLAHTMQWIHCCNIIVTDHIAGALHRNYDHYQQRVKEDPFTNRFHKQEELINSEALDEILK